jgi:hypothetical protein
MLFWGRPIGSPGAEVVRLRGRASTGEPLIARFAPIDESCIHRDHSPAGSADTRSRQQGANRAARCRHTAEKADNVCQDAGRDQKGTCDKNHHAVGDRWPGYLSVSIPQELKTIVPSLPSVPVQPLLLASQSAYGLFEHVPRFPWVLEPYLYEDQNSLLNVLHDKVITPAEDIAKKQAGAP